MKNSKFKIQNSKLQSKGGQSLIELVVMIGLALIVITALTILTMNSIRNTQFSNAQVQASKFAQDGIEKVRVIKTQNQVVCIDAATSQWNNLWSIPCNSSAICNKFVLKNTPPDSPSTICTASSGFWLDSAGSNSPAEDLRGGFSRVIYIEDHGATNTSRKKVRSVVTWTDVTGTHQSELVTILTDH